MAEQLLENNASRSFSVKYDSPRIPVQLDIGAPDKEEESWFDCKYCTKKFSNKQALGGHQNAHKSERALENQLARINNRNMSPKVDIHFGKPVRKMGSSSYDVLSRMALGPYVQSAGLVPIYQGIPFSSYNSSWAAVPPSANQGWAKAGSSSVGNSGLSSPFATAKITADEKNKEENTPDEDAGLDLTLKL